MTESDIKYVPYKELVKKRALEYYYANREAKYVKREKINISYYRLKRKKGYRRIIDSGIIIKRLKSNKRCV